MFKSSIYVFYKKPKIFYKTIKPKFTENYHKKLNVKHKSEALLCSCFNLLLEGSLQFPLPMASYIKLIMHLLY